MTNLCLFKACLIWSLGPIPTLTLTRMMWRVATKVQLANIATYVRMPRDGGTLWAYQRVWSQQRRMVPVYSVYGAFLWGQLHPFRQEGKSTCLPYRCLANWYDYVAVINDMAERSTGCWFNDHIQRRLLAEGGLHARALDNVLVVYRHAGEYARPPPFKARVFVLIPQQSFPSQNSTVIQVSTKKLYAKITRYWCGVRDTHQQSARQGEQMLQLQYLSLGILPTCVAVKARSKLQS